jgi:hypothetical protein
MSKITIGPFFSTVPQMEAVCPAMANLGIQMEWASSARAVQVQLFNRQLRSGRLRLEHLLFAQRKLDFDVPCAEHQIVQTANGVFLPLEGLLVGLYETHEVSRRIQQVLEELASVVPLENKVSKPILKPGYLVAEAEAQGFILNTLMPEGSQLYAEIVWRNKRSPYRFHTCICRFSLNQDAVLDEGAWVPAGTVTAGTLLARDLHRFVPGAPREMFSLQGIHLLESELRAAVGDGAKSRQTRMANEKPGIGVSGPL